MKLTATTTAILICITAFSQTVPNIQWKRCLGGSATDIATSIQQTIDNGYIIAGSSTSNDDNVSGNHGGYDSWIVKLKNNGDIQWQKSLGGNKDDGANSIQQTTDTGYIVAGSSNSFNGYNDVDYWILKLTKEGDIQWQKTMGGNSTDGAASIQQTIDGSYIVAGSSRSYDRDVTGNHGNNDYWIVKLTKKGGIQWQKSLGGSKDDYASSIEQTKDSGYIVAGTSYSNDGDVKGNHGGADYWIVKLTKKGDIQWRRTLGGSNNDEAVSINQTKDSGYVVAGVSYSNDGNVTSNQGGADYWIVKLTKKGDIQWQKSLGGSSDEVAFSIKQTKDNGYIVAGYSASNDRDVSGHHGNDSRRDYWIVKLTKKGSIQWQQCFGGGYDDEARSIQQATDSGYIVAGYTNSHANDVIGNHGNADYWVIKFDKEGTPMFFADSTNKFVINSLSKKVVESFTVYPNPAKDVLYVQTNNTAVFSLINSSGKIVLTKTITGNSSISVGSLPAGNYYLKNNTTQISKLVTIER